MKRRRKAGTTCWPKAVLLLSIIATLLSVGCLVAMVTYSINSSSDSGGKIKQSTSAAPTGENTITNAEDSYKDLGTISTRLQFPRGAAPFNMSINRGISMRKDENEIVVPFNGVYYVYSNIQFLNNRATKCKFLKNKVWKQVVYLTSENKESSKQLLEVYHTCCDECERERYTSFTAGKVYLNVNDTVHVEVTGHSTLGVSGAELILGNPFSFFGLMFLESAESNDSHCEQ